MIVRPDHAHKPRGASQRPHGQPANKVYKALKYRIIARDIKRSRLVLGIKTESSSLIKVPDGYDGGYEDAKNMAV